MHRSVPGRELQTHGAVAEHGAFPPQLSESENFQTFFQLFSDGDEVFLKRNNQQLCRGYSQASSWPVR